MKLGVDCFSLNWQGWDAFQTLNYVAELGVENIQFSERGFLATLDPGYLREVRAHADQLDLSIEVGMKSFDGFSSAFDPRLGSGEQQLNDMIGAAVICGSPIVRCLLGSSAERLGPTPIEEHIAECLRVLQAVAPRARELGVKIAVENHGAVDLLARELRQLVEQAGVDAVGVCLDTGNGAYAGEHPIVSTEILAPYVVTTQIRDTRVWATHHGAMAQWVPLGDGNLAIDQALGLLAARRPEIPINLEVITGRRPREIPYFDSASEFWRMYPGMLARDFAPFLAAVSTSTAGPYDQLILPVGVSTPPPDQLDAFRAQQRQHLEASVHYCRDLLAIGNSAPARS